MSDPAVEAAQRAWADRYIKPDYVTAEQSAHYNGVGALAISAAREMAMSVRKLHKPAYLNDNPYEPAEWDCGECESPWPCGTAKLVYSEEELDV